MNINEFDLTGVSIPWPQKGQRLFDLDSSFSNARINFLYENKWDIYATGYKEAADSLVNDALTGKITIDFAVYPMVFLYRHYLELRLKDTIIQGRQLIQDSKDLEQTHRLDVLWRNCRIILEKLWPSGSKEDLEIIEGHIQEFTELDMQSMSFRYPITKDGTATLIGLGNFGLGNFRDVMANIAALLDSSSSAISEYLSNARSNAY